MKNKIAIARIFGTEDFKNGLDCIPCLSDKLQGLLEEGSISQVSKRNAKLIRAWLKGWILANLNA